MVSQQKLHQLLNYDPATGTFTWKGVHHRSNGSLNRLATGTAGCLTNHGYRMISIGNVKYLASHLACLYMTGKLPEREMDSGVKGVGWNKRLGKWHARVRLHGFTYHCGYFASLEEAQMARDTKAAQLHGAFVRMDSLQTPILKGQYNA